MPVHSTPARPASVRLSAEALRFLTADLAATRLAARDDEVSGHDHGADHGADQDNTDDVAVEAEADRTIADALDAFDQMAPAGDWLVRTCGLPVTLGHGQVAAWLAEIRPELVAIQTRYGDLVRTADVLAAVRAAR